MEDTRRRHRKEQGTWTKVNTWIERSQAVFLLIGSLWVGYLGFRFSESKAVLEEKKLQGDIATGDVDYKTKEDQLRKAMRAGIRVASNLRVFCEREKGVYKAEYSYQIENTSSVEVPLTWEVIEAHIGTLDAAVLANKAKADVVLINEPPVRVLHVESTGAVQWKGFASTAHVLDSKDADSMREVLADFHPTLGGAVKNIRMHDKSSAGMVFRVVARPEQWVGVSLAFGITTDKVVHQDDNFRETSVQRLGDCERPERSDAARASGRTMRAIDTKEQS